ncbi:MAG: Calcineurin-like phosphoesterase [Methanobacterium sp. PtaU1.Bin242]|nr:MAG: Calcineurin-like phosphoesterase [Methanobacterium sp. PtaU1.Bin242]
MKIIFTTDLHGSQWKYLRVLEHAQNLDVDAVVNGGDLLPVNPGLKQQDSFIADFLDDHFSLYESSGIYYLFVMGNTDLKRFDALLQEISSPYHYVENLSREKIDIGRFEFIGFDLMTDYPFPLKDRCRRDTNHSNFKKQLLKAFLSSSRGLKPLEDWFSYVKTLPTLEEELGNLPQPEDMKKAVYVMHMPPAFQGLDVCQGNVMVGSMAIYDFFKNKQPLLSLHGHIHESPEMSSIWNSKINNTCCIQPGQKKDKLIYVICDLDEMEFQRFIEPAPTPK